jgi:Na+-translocating ferredoxin:NAD+ oxidoreductase RnfC subunit
MNKQSKEQIISAVRSAGIIGAGGGGFPTYVKLQASVDTIVANCSECEPLLSSDVSMMIEKPDLLIEGMQIAMHATAAKNGIIGIKEYYKEAVAALKKVLPKDNSIKLHFLENYYPAGDEFLLVYETTGKIIPEGGIPLNVGVVVNNAITLMQIAESCSGKPVTERAVTLAGEFNEPKVVTVPIGTTYNDLMKIAGGLKIKDAIFIDGGPMMGKLVTDLESGIAKTTSGFLAFPKDHFVARMAQQSLSQVIKQSKAACCQCFRCTDLCPRNLLGHAIHPHMTMRTIDYNQSQPTKHITSAFLCSQCGVCELFSCDFMQLSPRKIFAAYRKELVARGVKNLHNNKNCEVNSMFSYRKIAIPMLMQKIDIKKYYVPLEYCGKQEIKMVRVPLKRYAGTAALPKVSMGQKVRMCDVIAMSPEDKLGTVCHASISGKITEVNEDFIEIVS